MDKTTEYKWIVMTPDSEEYSEDGMKKAMEKVSAKIAETTSGFSYLALGKIRDTGFGQEELFELTGLPAQINDFLADIYDWAVDMTERGEE